jgi:predicted ATPase/DNA-binding CsgD family transcriptional regulator
MPDTLAHLPVPPTPFIGRQRELRALEDLLSADGARLITLTGAAGTGKTRLALQVALRLVGFFKSGIVFVDLAPISEAALVVPTVARALGVDALPASSLLETVIKTLHGGRMLVILDNFEQVAAAALEIAELIRACPEISVLVTSRTPLKIRGERLFPVPPLAVPDAESERTPAAVAEFESVALFVDRASAITPEFTLTNGNAASIAEICSGLDGLPLAIELAAGLVRLLSPEEMLPLLNDRLTLLSHGPHDLPVRQQTLRNAITWSYDLLSQAQQRLLRSLSVFAGGFTLQAAAAVCDVCRSENVVLVDLLAPLLDSSLLQTASQQRYAMLETVREYAAEQLLACDEATHVRDRHLAWCLAFAERIQSGPASTPAPEDVTRLEAELDNFRAALKWSEYPARDPELGLRLALAVASLWTIRGHFTEGRRWLNQLLACSPRRTSVRARSLSEAGFLAARQNDNEAATPLFEEATEIWHELGDEHGLSKTLRQFAVLRDHEGDYARAAAMLESSVSIERAFGDLEAVSTGLLYLADVELDRGDLVKAARTYREGMNLAARRTQTHSVAYGLRGLGHVARARGEYVRAGQLLRESLGLLAKLRDRRCVPLCLEGLACLAVGRDWAERATRLLGAAHAIQDITGAPAPPSEMADYTRTEADARTYLGQERFSAVWAAGASMSFDEAIAFALNDGLVDEELVRSRAAVPQKPEARASAPLSAREREVVAHIAAGRSNREIAQDLVVSVRTVERHIENIYNRLGIKGKAGRAIITAYALRHHLIAPG